jgi:hypothetical protein
VAQTQISFANGRRLGGPTAAENPDGCDYLSVYRDARTLAYVTNREVRHDPVRALTVLLDALADGRPVCPPELADPEYRAECVLVAANSSQLRCPAAGQPVDYVRVCAADGDELVYWICDEFAEDPQEVCGALLGLLHGGPTLGQEHR